MTQLSFSWLIAAGWAIACVIVGVRLGFVPLAVCAALGAAASLGLAGWDWWQEFRAYEPEGRHRNG